MLRFRQICQNGFEMKIRLNGYVTKENVQVEIKKFVRNTPTSNHGIKILAIVLMAYGGEHGW